MTATASTYDRRQPFPVPLSSELAWRYTGTTGLHGIWHQGALWASAARVLNDSQEVDFGVDAINRAWAKREPTVADRPAAAFVAEAIRAVAESATLLKSMTFVQVLSTLAGTRWDMARTSSRNSSPTHSTGF